MNEGNSFMKQFFLSMADSCLSKAVLFGMWGNVAMASFYEQAGKFFQKLAEQF